MKRPQPDIGDLLKASFIQNMGDARKLKRLWRTTNVEGVDTLTRIQYYHPRERRMDYDLVGEDQYKGYIKLMNFLNAYEDIENASMKGIRYAYLYFNKNKGSILGTDIDNFVEENLDAVWWDPVVGQRPENLVLRTSIVIEAEQITPATEDPNDKVTITDLLSPSMSVEALKQSIINNYDTLWDTCLISHQGVGDIYGTIITTTVEPIDETILDPATQEFIGVTTEVTVERTTEYQYDLTPDDVWLQTMSRYALLSESSLDVTVTNVSIGLGENEANNLYNTFVVDLEIKYNDFQTQSLLVQKIVNDILADYEESKNSMLLYPNGYYTQRAIKNMDSSAIDNEDIVITRTYRLWEDESSAIDARYDSLWFKDSTEGKWHLRADAFDNPRAYGMSYSTLFKYVSSCIDSGYKKKSAGFFKKLIAAIIFVAAVWFLGPVFGGGIAGYATAVVAASFVLTVISLAFSVLGLTEWASAFAEVNRFVEPLVMVASLYLAVTGAMNAYEAAKGATEKAATEVLADMAIDYVENFVDELVKGYADVMSGDLLTNAAMKFSTQMVRLVNLGMSLKLESINDRNKDLKAEYDRYLQEQYQESDVLKGFMRIYAMPATADWSMYASLYDLPYERGGGLLHTGNIQKTTKQALRKADYSDPAFDNILVV